MVMMIVMITMMVIYIHIDVNIVFMFLCIISFQIWNNNISNIINRFYFYISYYYITMNITSTTLLSSSLIYYTSGDCQFKKQKHLIHLLYCKHVCECHRSWSGYSKQAVENAFNLQGSHYMS